MAFRSAAEWERWLEDNHATAEGVWLKVAKQGTGIESSGRGYVLEVNGALDFNTTNARDIFASAASALLERSGAYASASRSA
jgi:hypothetical protein